MSNANKKRPRRNSTAESPGSSDLPHVANGLRYDAEEVPVLIRLPDLSPQALLRAPALKRRKPVSPATSTPVTATRNKKKTRDNKKPPVLELAKPVPASASTPTAAPPAAAKLADKPNVGKASDKQVSDDKSIDAQPDATATESTPAATEGSPRKRSRRNRGGRNDNTNQRDNRSASQPISRQAGGRRNAPTTEVERQDRNILPFDASPLIIVTGLLVVAGLTYVVMNGGDEAPDDSTGAWSDIKTEPLAGTIEETTEPEVNLWPADDDPLEIQHESSLATQPPPAFEATTPTPVPVWPPEPGVQAAIPYDPAPYSADEFTYSAPATAPVNDPINVTPSGDGPTSGWPSESPTPPLPNSTSGPVNGWPEAAMATPTPDAPNNRYASQPARYAEAPKRVDSFPNDPAIQTGRLETGPYPGPSFNTTANPGSHLNGTTEIPSARANNEYNGSSVY
jgi:hypothetical protein